MVKRLLLSVLIIFGFVANGWAQKEKVSLVFTETAHDFGRIMEDGGKVSHTFTFKNKGDAPVIITRIVADCGCVAAKYSDEPVMPGKKGEISISYDPWYRPGEFNKTVVVHHWGGISRLSVRGTVTPFLHPVEEDHPYDYGNGLHMSLKVLAFGGVAPDRPGKIAIRYANDTDSPMTLVFEVEGGDKNLVFTDPGELKPKERGRMYFTYTLNEEFTGQREFKIYPVVNGKRSEQPLGVRVRRK